MKKKLILLSIFLGNILNSCNLCWNYKNKDPRLIRENISHDSSCTCNCWEYPHTQGDNNFYRCIVCGHRLTPPDPLAKNGPQYKRFEQQSEFPQKPNTIQPLLFVKKHTTHPMSPKTPQQSIEFPILKLKR